MGFRGRVKLSISRKSESCDEGDVVCPRAVFDAFDPGLSWTSSCVITWYSSVVCLLVGVHSRQVPEPLNPLSIDMALD